MKDYLLVILSVVLLAFCFVLQKLYQKQTDSATQSAVDFSIITGLFSTLLLVITEGFSISLTPFSAINAFLRSACVLAYTVIGFKIMRVGSVAFYMLFLMSGGMLLPSVYGWLFLGETPEILHILGVAVILVSIIITNVGQNRVSLKLVLMCVAVFVLNGFVSIFSKLHQINTHYAAVSTVEYTMLTTIATLIMSVILRLVLHFKSHEKIRIGFLPVPIIIALVYSIGITLSSVLQLSGAKNLPASMLYPMITGGSIAFSGLLGLVCLKEKLSKKGWISVALCFVGTCLFI